MRYRRSFSIAFAALAAFVPVAHGQREATVEELPLLASAAGLAAQCITATVSTVDDSWAVATVASAADCPAGNGVIVLQRVDGAWSSYTSGSADPAQPCPFDDGIPTVVQTDLRLCTAPAPKPPKGESFAGALLRALPGWAELTSPAYSRSKFKHWINIGQTGCNARYVVLWQETLRRPKPACSSRTGRWRSAYDGVVLTRASQLDVDHMIPLAEAWRSGAATRWDSATRQRFANDTSYPHSLIAVSASSNRSKSDKDPSEWLPPLAGFHCAYAVRWVAVKYRWKLHVDPAERTALQTILNGCPRAAILIPTPPRAAITNNKPASTGGSGGSGGSGSGSGYPVQPDQPGDQDCSDFDGPVQVLPGDPDRLDADGDGIGCEG
jgi:hypothetical protein